MYEFSQRTQSSHHIVRRRYDGAYQPQTYFCYVTIKCIITQMSLDTWKGRKSFPQICHNQEGWGAKVDADHAADMVTRRSLTGFLVYLNCSLIFWFSKKQSSCESSTFVSEFTAMKQCCEYIKGLEVQAKDHVYIL